MTSNAIRVCFICLGNICRSPMAEAVFRYRASERGLVVLADSAGTSSEHAGEPAHPLTREVLRRAGIPIDHRAKQFDHSAAAGAYDWLIAMDRSNLQTLRSRAPNLAVHLLRSFDPTTKDQEVRDPWGSGIAAYEETLAVVERACDGFLRKLASSAREG